MEQDEFLDEDNDPPRPPRPEAPAPGPPQPVMEEEGGPFIRYELEYGDGNPPLLLPAHGNIPPEAFERALALHQAANDFHPYEAHGVEHYGQAALQGIPEMPPGHGMEFEQDPRIQFPLQQGLPEPGAMGFDPVEPEIPRMADVNYQGFRRDPFYFFQQQPQPPEQEEPFPDSPTEAEFAQQVAGYREPRAPESPGYYGRNPFPEDFMELPQNSAPPPPAANPDQHLPPPPTESPELEEQQEEESPPPAASPEPYQPNDEELRQQRMEQQDTQEESPPPAASPEPYQPSEEELRQQRMEQQDTQEESPPPAASPEPYQPSEEELRQQRMEQQYTQKEESPPQAASPQPCQPPDSEDEGIPAELLMASPEPSPQASPQRRDPTPPPSTSQLQPVAVVNAPSAVMPQEEDLRLGTARPKKKMGKGGRREEEGSSLASDRQLRSRAKRPPQQEVRPPVEEALEEEARPSQSNGRRLRSRAVANPPAPQPQPQAPPEHEFVVPRTPPPSPILQKASGRRRDASKARKTVSRPAKEMVKHEDEKSDEDEKDKVFSDPPLGSGYARIHRDYVEIPLEEALPRIVESAMIALTVSTHNNLENLPDWKAKAKERRRKLRLKGKKVSPSPSPTPPGTPRAATPLLSTSSTPSTSRAARASRRESESSARERSASFRSEGEPRQEANGEVAMEVDGEQNQNHDGEENQKHVAAQEEPISAPATEEMKHEDEVIEEQMPVEAVAEVVQNDEQLPVEAVVEEQQVEAQEEPSSSKKKKKDKKNKKKKEVVEDAWTSGYAVLSEENGENAEESGAEAQVNDGNNVVEESADGVGGENAMEVQEETPQEGNGEVPEEVGEQNKNVLKREIPEDGEDADGQGPSKRARATSSSVSRSDTPVPSTSAGPTITDKYAGDPVDISGWTERRLISFFGLKTVVLEVPALSEEDIAKYAVEPSFVSRRSRSPLPKKARNLRISSDSESPSPPRKKSLPVERRISVEETKPPLLHEPRTAGLFMEDDEMERRTPCASPAGYQGSRSLSPPASPDFNDEENEGQLQQRRGSGDAQCDPKDKKYGCKRDPIMRRCCQCGRDLHTCVDDWYLKLGADSQYCSSLCVDAVVDRVLTIVEFDASKRITMIGPSDQVRCGAEGALASQLGQFIRQSSSWVPVCITERAHELEKMEAEAVATVAAKAPKPMSKDSDTIRLGVRKAIADALINRMKKTPGCSYRMKDCKEKAETLELELFKHCKQNPTSPQYKSWFKKFIIQVKDLKNKSLFLKVLSGEITVQKIVTVEPEELGSKEFSGMGDSADSAEATPFIPPASAETTAATKELSKHVPVTASVPTMGRIPKKPKPAPGAASTLDALLGDGNTDTTSLHQSHFYDTNCSICASKAKSVADLERKEREDKERFKEEERLRKEKKDSFSMERIQHYDMGTPRKEKEMDRKEMKKKKEMGRRDRRSGRRRTRSLSEEDEEEEEQPEFDPKDPLGLSRQESPKTTYAGSDDGDFGGDGGDSPFDDSWRIDSADPEKNHRKENRKKEDSWRDSPRQIEVAPVRNVWDRSHIVWRGQMVMGNLAFVSSLIAVSNPVAFEMSASTDLSASLRIKGRIKPIVVFEYLSSLRQTGSHHVICMKLEKPLDDEGEKRYMSIYTDMLCKDRYQVLDMNGNGQVKDGYLIPVEEDVEPPAVLLPFDGPGVGERHPEMIMCIMIRFKHRTDSWRAVDPDAFSQPQHEQVPPPVASSELPQMPEGVSLPPFNGVMSRTALSALTEKVSALLESRKEPTVEVEKSPDALLPKKFFDLLKKDEEQQPEQQKSATKPLIDASDVHTLADLLLFIQVIENPKKMKEVVSRFMTNPELTEKDRDIIKKKVMEKIAVMKRKKDGKNDDGSTPMETAQSTSEVTVAGNSAMDEDEYQPEQPNEPDDEPAQDNDSTAGTIAEDTRCLSPSDFDTDRPTSFLDAVNKMDVAGMLSDLSAPPPPVPPTFDNTSDKAEDESRPVSNNSALVVAEDGLLPPISPPATENPASGIPLPPTAPELELASIPTPSFSQSNNAQAPGGIPVLCRVPSQVLDVSEANSVEAVLGGDSPPDEEDSQDANDVVIVEDQLPPPQQQVQQPMFYPPVPQPPPQFYPGMPIGGPLPMGIPPPTLYGQPPHHISMMSVPPPSSMMSGPPPTGMLAPPPGAITAPPPIGMPPTMSMGPIPHPMPAGPPMLTGPPMLPLPPVPQPLPMEVHGSAGFRGLAPSLGGQRPVRDSIIDYFQTGQKPEGDKPTDPTATTVVLPPGASTRHIGYMPGFGRSATKHDNIPRTPTPPWSHSVPSKLIRPGAAIVRPGAAISRPGAVIVKRLAPGARIPQRMPSPDAEELEIMKREERRRLKQLEREQEAEKRRMEEEELERKRQQKRLEHIRSGGNAEALAKIPRNAPPSVVLLRVRWVADTEGCTTEEAEEIVREHHMMKSDDESSSDDAAASSAQSEPSKKKRGGKRERRRRGIKEQHITGYVHIRRQKRALNVEYEDENESDAPRKEDSARDLTNSSQDSEPTASPQVLSSPVVAPPPPPKPHNPLVAPPPPPPPPPPKSAPKPAPGPPVRDDFSRDFSPPPSFTEMRCAPGGVAVAPPPRMDFGTRHEVEQPSTSVRPSDLLGRDPEPYRQPRDYGSHQWEDDWNNAKAAYYEREERPPGPSQMARFDQERGLPMRGGLHQQRGGRGGGFAGRIEEDFHRQQQQEGFERSEPTYRPLQQGPGAPGGPGDGWDQDFHRHQGPPSQQQPPRTQSPFDDNYATYDSPRSFDGAGPPRFAQHGDRQEFHRHQGPPSQQQPPRTQSPFDDNYSTYDSPRSFDGTGPPRFTPRGDRTPLHGGRGGHTGPSPPFRGGPPQRGAFHGRGGVHHPAPSSSGFFNAPSPQKSAPPPRGAPMNRGVAPEGRGGPPEHWNSPRAGAQGTSWTSTQNPPARGLFDRPPYLNSPHGPPKPPPLMPGAPIARGLLGPGPGSFPPTTNKLMMAPPPPPPPPPRRY